MLDARKTDWTPLIDSEQTEFFDALSLEDVSSLADMMDHPGYQVFKKYLKNIMFTMARNTLGDVRTNEHRHFLHAQGGYITAAGLLGLRESDVDPAKQRKISASNTTQKSAGGTARTSRTERST